MHERLAIYQTLDSREQPDEGVEVDEKKRRRTEILTNAI
jgi:hypothetical protein